MPVAMVPARLLEDRAEPARLEAWLNLSQREKASELVMVRTRAMAVRVTVSFVCSFLHCPPFPPSPRLCHARDVPMSTCTPGGEKGEGGKTKRLRWERDPRTNQRQPYEPQPDDDEQGQANPQQRLDVDGEPEEAAVGRVDFFSAGLASLEDPVAVSRCRVDFVPPP